MTDYPRSKWILTSEAMERLLQALSTDREAAGQAYELLRRRLIKFFQWDQCPDAEQCADESINRLARRLESGERIENVQNYALGVARLVRMEVRAALHKEAVLLDTLTTPAAIGPDPCALHCLDRCLDRLAAAEKEFLLRYYSGRGRDQAEQRREMAERHEMNINALRNRALRLRERVERCVRQCLSQESVMKDAE